MTDDAELLRRYAEQHDQDAFAELVRRHLGLVFHAALRQCGGDAYRAQDVAQTVFADLARKAGRLAERPVLSGWLYTSTRYAASQAVRGEARRQAREREAHAMSEIISDPGVSASAEWERLRPVIDETLHALSERDREALLLRFFEGRAFADIGAKLRLSEDAARMRVERALDKMRTALSGRGVTSTTAALTLAMTGQAVAAVPVGMASTVASAALSSAAAGGAMTATLTFMSSLKLKIGILGVIAAAGTTGLVLETQSHATLRNELTALREQQMELARLRVENNQLAKVALELATYRADDAELARLSDEAAALKVSLQQAAQARAQSKAAAELTARMVIPRLPFDPKSSEPDRRPIIRISNKPIYPTEMLLAGVGGEVLVDLIVNSKGEVANAYAAKSSRREFEAAAVDAVRKWQFDPGVKGHAAVATHVQTTVTFQTSQGRDVATNPDWF